MKTIKRPEQTSDPIKIKRNLDDLVLSHLVFRSSGRIVSLGRPLQWDSLDFGMVNKGRATAQIEGGDKIVLEEGDVIGPWLGDLRQLCVTSETLTCKFWAFTQDDLEAVLSGGQDRRSAWTNYARLQTGSKTPVVSRQGQNPVAPEKVRHSAQRMQFNPGAVIIRQGDFGTQVYSIEEGEADVIVDGVRVGNLTPGEIFGAYGALSGQKRGATVIATTYCAVLMLEKEDFLSGLREKPESIVQLITEMGRTVAKLNGRLVGIDEVRQLLHTDPN